jgi:hypothetical protein
MDKNSAIKIIQKAWKKYNDIYLQKLFWTVSPLFEWSIIDKTRTSKKKKALIDFYKTMNIEFIKMSDLIKK